MDELNHYLTQVETLAEPSATRLVREATGTLTIRDNNDTAKYLPSNMSKRGCYRQYCQQRGEIVVTSHDGSCTLDNIDNVNNNKECISWCYFFNYWKSNFSHLKVSKPSHDIYKECYIFFNCNKYFSSATEKAGSESNWDNKEEEEEDSDWDNNKEEVENSDNDEDKGNNLIMAEGCNRGLHNEAQILKATMHVKNAKSMRDYLNAKIRIAREDIVNNIPWQERHNCLIGDYAQYMHLPFFGKRQPGDTYYLVPLNVSNFGMVNVAAFNYKGEVKDHLYAHVYKEGTAKRGGNEVSSLVMKTLKHLHWLDVAQNGKGKELVLAFDNCPGQNKNGMVIRLAMFLVEMDYFENVVICFLA